MSDLRKLAMQEARERFATFNKIAKPVTRIEWQPEWDAFNKDELEDLRREFDDMIAAQDTPKRKGKLI